MVITKRIISDEILFKLSAGYPDVSFQTQKQDIWAAIDNEINSMCKMEYFTQSLPTGETIPTNLNLATYTDIPINSYLNGQKSICTLPVMPISLPRNIGVYEITIAVSLGIPFVSQFIPLQAGQSRLLSTDTLLNDLMGDVGYEVVGSKVIFTKDITFYTISKVDMRLVVFEISNYSETDMLPITADKRTQLVDTLYTKFSPIQPTIDVNSNYPDANQLIGK